MKNISNLFIYLWAGVSLLVLCFFAWQNGLFEKIDSHQANVYEVVCESAPCYFSDRQGLFFQEWNVGESIVLPEQSQLLGSGSTSEMVVRRQIDPPLSVRLGGYFLWSLVELKDYSAITPFFESTTSSDGISQGAAPEKNSGRFHMESLNYKIISPSPNQKILANRLPLVMKVQFLVRSVFEEEFLTKYNMWKLLYVDQKTNKLKELSNLTLRRAKFEHDEVFLYEAQAVLTEFASYSIVPGDGSIPRQLDLEDRSKVGRSFIVLPRKELKSALKSLLDRQRKGSNQRLEIDVAPKE